MVSPYKNRSSEHKYLLIVVLTILVVVVMRPDQQPTIVESPPKPAPTTPAVVVQAKAEPAPLPEPYACIDNLPDWWKESSPEKFRQAILKGSEGLTDKVHIRHAYQHMYFRYMRDIVYRACEKGTKKIRILEIGLGCHPKGGMVNGTPGGSAKGWRYAFPAPQFELDLHIFEYDENCGKKWAEANSHIATVHYGDQGKKEDLLRVVNEAGGGGFDVIIDDGSHLNHHQILAAEYMPEFLAMGGVLVLEDIHSACMSWKANMGSFHGEQTGGNKGCLTLDNGDPTILQALLDMQKKLVMKKEPVQDIIHIDITFEAAVLQKYIAK